MTRKILIGAVILAKSDRWEFDEKKLWVMLDSALGRRKMIGRCLGYEHQHSGKTPLALIRPLHRGVFDEHRR